MTSSWTLCGRRKQVPYENPQRRRVNVMAAVVPYGPAPQLRWGLVARTLTSADLLIMLEHIPRGDGPLVVVLDNGSLHSSQQISAAQPALAERGIRLYYLPPYSPELNVIEPILGGIKAHELVQRSYPTLSALCIAIDQGFGVAAQRLKDKHAH